MRVVERFVTRAWSASVGVLERVFRVAIQLFLVLGSSPALDSVVRDPIFDWAGEF